MPTYIPNANDATEPTESRSVESAALEFRTFKANAVQYPIADPSNSKGLMPTAASRAGTVLAFDEITGAPVVGPNIATVGTVAANVGNINAVGSNIADVNAVAANLADITAVIPNLAPVTTVANDISSVVDVANIDVEVQALAGLNVEILALYAELPNIATKVSKTSDTGAAILPAGDTSERPTPLAGHFRFNNELSQFEGYNGTAWAALADTANVYGPFNGQLAGMRNKIINGKMEIAQRGTSFPASSGYTLDRFLCNTLGDVVTASQQSDAPSSNEFQNSLRVTVTTAKTSLASGDYGQILQPVEGFNARDLIGRTFTLSFWVRSSKTGTHCVVFKNSGGNLRSYVSEYTVSAANTWEFKSITVTGGLITAGTWNWTNGIGLDVRWVFAAGSTWQTTANAWQTGDFLATANQVNCLDTVGNIFAITGVQLEVGSVATPFEHRPYGAELALCQRYFERLIGAFNNPWLSVGIMNTSTDGNILLNYTVPKRATPTLINSGTQVNASSFVISGTIVDGSLSRSRVFISSISPSLPAGSVFAFQAGPGAFFDINAEL